MSTTPEEKFNSEKAQILGGILKGKREEQNISIGEAAERLKLTAKQIEYIESGDYNNLPEPVFVRGFLRNYARFLNATELDLATEIEEIFPKSKAAATNNTVKPGEKSLNFQQQEAPKSFPKAVPFALAAVVVVGGILAWQSKSNSQSENVESLASMEIADVQSSTPSGNVVVVPMDSLEASANAASVQTESAASEQAASAPVAALPGELSIHVRYRSSLLVTDSTGKVMHDGIVAANSDHKFTDGQAPYKVKIGYGSGSTMQFGGQEVDLTSHFTSGKTIELTVPQQ